MGGAPGKSRRNERSRASLVNAAARAVSRRAKLRKARRGTSTPPLWWREIVIIQSRGDSPAKELSLLPLLLHRTRCTFRLFASDLRSRRGDATGLRLAQRCAHRGPLLINSSSLCSRTLLCLYRRCYVRSHTMSLIRTPVARHVRLESARALECILPRTLRALFFSPSSCSCLKLCWDGQRRSSARWLMRSRTRQLSSR